MGTALSPAPASREAGLQQVCSRCTRAAFQAAQCRQERSALTQAPVGSDPHLVPFSDRSERLLVGT